MSIDTLKVLQEITILAPLGQVWAFLMDGEKMKRWLKANEFVIDVNEGGKIEIPLSFDGEKCFVEGEIGLVIPHQKFVFTWLERNAYGETWFNNTMVTILLEEKGAKTKLTLIHDGFKYLPIGMQTAVFQKYRAFWEETSILLRLQSLILEK